MGELESVIPCGHGVAGRHARNGFGGPMGSRFPVLLCLALSGLIATVAGGICRAASEAPVAASSDESAVSVSFTPEESQWLASHPSIVLGIADSYEPAAIRNPDGQPTGFLVELFELVGGRIGVPIRIVVDSPTTLARQVKDNELDGLAAVAQASADAWSLLATKPYLTVHAALFVRSDFPSALVSPKDLIGKTVAEVEDTAVSHELFRECENQVRLVRKETAFDALLAVFEGKADAMAGLTLTNYLVQRKMLTGIVPAYVDPKEVPVSAGIRADRPELVSILNKGLETVPRSTVDALVERWVGSIRPKGAPLALTPEEQAWLAGHPVLRVGADPEWAPIEFRDNEGTYRGITPEYMDFVARLLNVRLEYVREPWATLLELGKSGKLDAFTSLAPTPEREQDFVFTSSYASFPTSILTREDIVYVGRLNELKGRKVAACRGYGVCLWLRTNHPELDLVAVETVSEALRALAAGEVDAYVENRLVATYYLREAGYSNLRFAGDTAFTYKSCFAVPRDRAALAGILDKALRSIPAGEGAAIYERWASFGPERQFDYSLLWKVMAGACAVVLGFAYWNRRLSKEVFRRTQALDYAHELQQMTFEQTFQLIGLLEPDGTLRRANRTALEFAGLEEEAVVGRPFWETPWWGHDTAQQALVRDAVARAAQGEIVRFEATHVDASGELRTVDFSIKPVRDAAGAIVCLVPEGRDITAMRSAQAAHRDTEELCRTLFENAGDAIVILSKEVFVDCNEMALEVYGCRRDELLGQSPYAFSPPTQPDGRSSKEMALERITRALAGQPQSFEWVHLRRDGTPFDAEVSLNAIRMQSGELVQAIVRDVSRRKQAEEALRRSDAMLRTVFRVAPVGICMMKDRRYLSANEYWCKMFGYPEESLIGKTTRMLYESDEEYDRVGRSLYANLQEQGVASVETRLRRSDGVYRDTIVTVSPLHAGDIASGTVVIVHDITERKRAEEELRRNEKRLQGLVDLLQHSAPNTQAFLDYALEKSIEMTESAIGYIYFYHEDRSEFELNTWSRDVMAECAVANPQTCYELDKTGLWGEAVRQGKPIVVNDFEAFHPLRKGYPDGHVRLVRFMTVPVFSGGHIVAVVGVANKKTDYTDTDILQLTLLMDSVWKVTEQRQSEQERERLQAQLYQAQRIESVGRLAGGVAHDFNNMLGVILGHTEMALRTLSPSQPLYDGLTEVSKAARRSADLTRQLLAFARKQTVAPKILDLNETVQGMLKMLRRLIGEDIDLLWIPGRELWSVMMDPSQVDQIMANLCVNARDAIGGVGRITIETCNTTFSGEARAQYGGPAPGAYVMLTVSDTGSGMDQETLSHVFEPFFTTKAVGEGTGLGLATVYGIVKQNEGHINVYSEPKQGTTFKIYLPACNRETVSDAHPVVVQAPTGSREIVLLVEDEPMLLELGRAMLQQLEYTVLAAATPSEAMRLAETNKQELRLLVTDVIMPEMNGRELADALKMVCPGLKCLFVSGYTADVMANRGVLEEHAQFIQKPISLDELARKVYDILHDE